MVVGTIAFRDFTNSLVVIPSYAGNPKCRNPDSLRSSNKSPLDQWIWWCREFAYCGFVMQGFRVLEIPDTSIPDMPMGPTADGSWWLPPVPQMGGLDCIRKSRIAIPLCKSFTTLETPICQTLTFWDLSPRVLTDGRCWSCREIADRDFLLRAFHVLQNPDILNFSWLTASLH
jgi:hypothetical protein